MARPTGKAQSRSPKPSQLLLLKNLYKIVSHTSVVLDAASYARDEGLTTSLQGFDDSRADTLINGLYPYTEDPDVLVSTLVNPPIAGEFVHACPNVLSVLEPHMRFYIRDNQGNEEEVYFGDHTSAALARSLAQTRRNAGTLDEVFGPRRPGGSNVGIKSFSWNYDNKHEGDRIIGANLELYFGSLVELLNINYLKFLFTNGLRTPHAKPLDAESRKAADTEASRIKALESKIAEAMKTITDSKAVSTSTDFNAGLKNDFRQLRVTVGWAVPKGSQRQLIKLFRGKDQATKRQKLNRFLESVQVMQRVIMLNLVDYNVNFQQEGPTTLSIQYVGSTDNYITSPTSDVFGSHNTKDDLISKGTSIPVDDINLEDVWADGYLASIVSKGKGKSGTPLVKGPDGQTLATVRAAKLIEETDILMDKLSLLRLKYKGAPDPDNNHEDILRWMGPLESAYDKVQKAQMAERLEGFLGSMIDRHKVFVGTVKADPAKSFGASETVEVSSALAHSRAELKDRLKDLVKSYDTVDSSSSPEQADTISKGADAPTDATRRIYFVRLGDLISTAMKKAQLRHDVNLILGSFSPYDLGIPGYGSASADRFEALYNLPISIEYVSQFFYDNVVATGAKTYPFKRFIDDLMSMVGRLMNEVSEYRLRLIFDMSLYSSFWDVQELDDHQNIHILTEEMIKSFPTALKNRQLTDNVAAPIYNYYVVFARQVNHATRKGNRKQDEDDGVFHYIIGAECGIAKKFNFRKMDQAHFKALNIESAHYSSTSGMQSSAAARALFLPQNITIDMVGNSIHRNGDLIYVDSRMALGAMGNEVLALGGYYRVVKSQHNISAKGYTTQIECVFEKRTMG